MTSQHGAYELHALSKAIYTHVRAHVHAPGQKHASEQSHTHTNKYYLLLFHATVASLKHLNITLYVEGLFVTYVIQ
jgi:hypothetical protein